MLKAVLPRPVIAAEARKSAAMASDRVVPNAPTSASSAKPATSSVVERFPVDIQNRWRNACGRWSRKLGN